jgi:hypothetical protein
MFNSAIIGKNYWHFKRRCACVSAHISRVFQYIGVYRNKNISNKSAEKNYTHILCKIYFFSPKGVYCCYASMRKFWCFIVSNQQWYSQQTRRLPNNQQRFSEVYYSRWWVNEVSFWVFGVLLFSMTLPAHSAPWPFIRFRNPFSQTVELLGLVISSSQGLYINTG